MTACRQVVEGLCGGGPGAPPAACGGSSRQPFPVGLDLRGSPSGADPMGAGCFPSPPALSTEISAPDSLVQCRLTLRLFYIALGMKYKYIQIRLVPTASVG